jgi:acylphosphatase
MKKQIHVHYNGTVQGVGFRFTVEAMANDCGVTGWVKNLADGRVEVRAQASEDVLKDFLQRIDKHLGRYIQNTDTHWQEAREEFKDFGIRF